MLIVLPGPAAARVHQVISGEDLVSAEFIVRDPAQRDALMAVLAKAAKDGYAVEVRLLSYSGCADGALARAAREGGKSAVMEEP